MNENNLMLNIGILSESGRVYHREIAVNQCIRGAAQLGLRWEQVTSRNRTAHIVDGKRLCVMLLRRKGWNFQSIAEHIGLTNHASALYHSRRGEELLSFDTDFQAKHHQFMTA